MTSSGPVSRGVGCVACACGMLFPYCGRGCCAGGCCPCPCVACCNCCSTCVSGIPCAIAAPNFCRRSGGRPASMASICCSGPPPFAPFGRAPCGGPCDGCGPGCGGPPDGGWLGGGPAAGDCPVPPIPS